MNSPVRKPRPDGGARVLLSPPQAATAHLGWLLGRVRALSGAFPMPGPDGYSERHKCLSSAHCVPAGPPWSTAGVRGGETAPHSEGGMGDLERGRSGRASWGRRWSWSRGQRSRGDLESSDPAGVRRGGGLRQNVLHVQGTAEVVCQEQGVLQERQVSEGSRAGQSGCWAAVDGRGSGHLICLYKCV